MKKRGEKRLPHQLKLRIMRSLSHHCTSYCCHITQNIIFSLKILLRDKKRPPIIDKGVCCLLSDLKIMCYCIRLPMLDGSNILALMVRFVYDFDWPSQRNLALFRCVAKN